MAERQRFRKCGLCGHHHAGVAHVWDKANSPTLAEVKAATAGLERVFPSPGSNSKPAPVVGASASDEGGAPRLSAKPPKAAPPKFPRSRKKAGPVMPREAPGRRPKTPAATVITSPKGVRAVVHSDKKKPTKPETIKALGALVDATVEAMDKKAKARGRPKVHADRKAYKAQKERERRAKLKEPTNG